MAFLDPSLTRPATLWRGIGIALGGAALISLGAKVQIPFWPVPMTLHTLAVFFLAAALGPRLGTAAVVAYLTAGALGMPVFSGTPERGIGLAYMAGPTGGYLAGYLLGAGLTGWLAQGRGLIGRFLAMLAGLAVVYALGLAWLASFVPASSLLAAGFTPFILGDLIKLALASGLIAAFARLRAQLSSSAQ
ncbi:MAG: biotin biosynthesis protein BioY [Confluentimicrobium sp.]|uniref:biotin transporter BioY n=1 Tax=Actibacterium sp. TaxID=1872125 RepID=UPI000C61042D|nr:biotin transporter BioY [Actibacterium sp.]MBC57545.1 biotin biosynthesis protein BioY [Actibacterium sp.]